MVDNNDEISIEVVLNRWANAILVAQQQKEAIGANGCLHEFREYHGFREAYRYCVKCDAKTELIVE